MAKMILASIFDKESGEFVPMGIFKTYKDFVQETKRYPDVKFFDSEVEVGKIDGVLVADYN